MPGEKSHLKLKHHSLLPTSKPFIYWIIAWLPCLEASQCVYRLDIAKHRLQEVFQSEIVRDFLCTFHHPLTLHSYRSLPLPQPSTPDLRPAERSFTKRLRPSANQAVHVSFIFVSPKQGGVSERVFPDCHCQEQDGESTSTRPESDRSSPPDMDLD